MNIRKIGFTALIAFVSAFAAVATFNYFGWNKQQVSVIENDTPATLAAYARSSESQPIDLRYAAATSTPSVVHIKSTFEAEKVSSRGNQDPFQDFFGNDFYKYFHGPNPYQSQPQVATGSGVIVSKDGFIVTNNHVVENADEIEVMMNNNKSYKAKLIGRDKDTDLALVKIEGSDLPSISFANSDSVLIGEWVMAVGNPFNLASTVTVPGATYNTGGTTITTALEN